jgi:regulatory protein
VAAFELLARNAWSARELHRRLERRGAPPDLARSVVAELETRGYVDDGAFARAWADTRARGRRVGSRRLRQELAARGIARPLVDAAVAAAFGEVGEEERALEAGRRRLPALLRQGRPDRAPGRLYRYLVRRGYPAGLIASVVRRLTGAEAEGEPPA